MAYFKKADGKLVWTDRKELPPTTFEWVSVKAYGYYDICRGESVGFLLWVIWDETNKVDQWLWPLNYNILLTKGQIIEHVDLE